MSDKLQFSLPFDADLALYLQDKHPSIFDYRILSKSLDARNAPRGKRPQFTYVLEVLKDESDRFSDIRESFDSVTYEGAPPIIVGAGPAGLFCALRLSEYGIKSIVLERGDVAQKRMLHISRYWRHGELNPESNVCYGEGGAGLFSDGKLITRIKSPYVKYVMHKFVDFGAPADTAYISNPHLGSNKIRTIITKISDYLTSRGHEIRANVRVDEILFKENKAIGVLLNTGEKLLSEHVILAGGHSAKEMYHHLFDEGVAMQPKDFAVGVRVEHPRAVMDQLQHGEYCESPLLGAARYKVSYHDKNTDRGTYSFCMCPGGYVLSSGTEADGVVVNGMSNYARNSRWSNSALVVSVKAGVDFDDKDILAGLRFQHEIEQNAFELSKKHADARALPAMTVGEFLANKLNDKELPKTSCPSGIFKANLRDIFPAFITEHLEQGLAQFDQQIKGFSYQDALLIAPETRTSAPITILRDKQSFISTSHRGLYPCGEGAGHAGGITSAAVDGVKVAESIVLQLRQ